MIKILLAGILDNGISERLKVIPEFEIQERDFDSISTLTNDCREVDAAVLDSRISCGRELLSNATEIKLIVRSGPEFAEVDEEFLNSRGIELRDTVFPTASALADYTMGLMLAGLNHIGPDYSRFHCPEGEWGNMNEIRGFRGKTFGIAGLDHNFEEIAGLALAMGMKVIYSDSEAQWTDLAVRQVPMAHLMQTADIVCLALSRSQATRELVGGKQIECMKPGAILIDFSAPGIVNLSVVIKALKEGVLSAAALDVDPLSKNDRNEASGVSGLYPLAAGGRARTRSRERYGYDVVSILKGFFNV